MSSTILTDRPTPLTLLSASLIYILYTLALSLLLSYRRHRISRQHGCKPIPAYPHKDPLFGLDVFLESARLIREGGFLEGLEARFERLGCYTWSQLFMGSRLINTAEPENIKTILATSFKSFELPPRRKAAFLPTFGHGIFTTDGPEWEASRSLLRPNFVRSQVGDIEIFSVHISKLIARIPRDGQTVDLQALFFMLTMDSATEFLFGRSSDVLGSGGDEQERERRERGERFQDAFTYVTERIGVQSRVGKLATIWPDRRMERAIADVHGYIEGYIKQALALRASSSTKSKYTSSDSNSEVKLERDDENENEKAEQAGEEKSRYVFLEHLAAQPISEKKIQDELLNILLAGRDTTASLLSYVFYMLARRKDVLGKLRGEVEKLGGGRPTFEELKGMRYLQAVLNETLRLHPIVPANSRICVQDTILPVGGGPDQKSPIFVKKGTQINYQVYVMHRRKDLYGEDAEEFRPERWEGLKAGWQYLPFNGGPRICIGQQFALTEAAFTVVRLLQAFQDVQPRDDGKFTDYLTLTAAVRGGVKVAMIPA